MASYHPNRQLAELEISEPLILGETGDDADSDIEAHQLRTYLDSSKATKRRRHISFLVGFASLFILIGIFARLSRRRHLVGMLKPHFRFLFPDSNFIKETI
jgi:hypothetical protein